MARKAWAKIPIPTSAPTGTICVQVNVPNQFEHRTAFADAIYKLSKAYYWADDTAHTAISAAAIWLPEFESICAQLDARGSCPSLDVRQSPTDPCILEKSTDGITWTPFADLLACAPILETGLQGLNQGYHTTGGTTFFRVPDGAWVDDPPATWFANLVPVGKLSTQTNSQCDAAANAANTIILTANGIGTDLALALEPSGETLAAIIDGIGVLFGIPIGAEAATAIFTAFGSIQALFGLVTFSDDDFRKFACYIYNHMTGTTGAWTLDYSAINNQGNLTAAGIEFFHAGALCDIMSTIGSNGLNLAAKTTAISGYDCAAHTDYYLDERTIATKDIFNNSDTILSQMTKVLSNRFALARIQVLTSTWNSVGTKQVYQGSGVSGFTNLVWFSGSGGFPAGVDIWVMNNPLFGNSTTNAQTAIRQILGDPTATPTIYNAGNGTLDYPAGTKFIMGHRAISLNANFVERVTVDYYSAKVQSGC